MKRLTLSEVVGEADSGGVEQHDVLVAVLAGVYLLQECVGGALWDVGAHLGDEVLPDAARALLPDVRREPLPARGLRRVQRPLLNVARR